MVYAGYRIVVTRGDGSEFQLTFGTERLAMETWEQLVNDTGNIFGCKCYCLYFGRVLLRTHRL